MSVERILIFIHDEGHHAIDEDASYKYKYQEVVVLSDLFCVACVDRSESIKTCGDPKEVAN